MFTLRISLIFMVVGILVLGDNISAFPVPMSEVPFQKRLLDAASKYKSWGRVDDEMRWAPHLCRMPNPGQPYVSASQDEATHGQKLYSIYASKRDEYFQIPKDKPVTVGQVIVKESWIPEEITDSKDKPDRKRIDFNRILHTPLPNPDPKRKIFDHESDHFYPYVWKGDKVFKASKQAGLYIMMKLDPTTSDTDEGWVYGTLSADGKKVTSAGRVESCMKCHRAAKGDRLFGIWK